MLFQEMYLQILSVFPVPKPEIIGVAITQAMLPTICEELSKDN